MFRPRYHCANRIEKGAAVAFMTNIVIRPNTGNIFTVVFLFVVVFGAFVLFCTLGCFLAALLFTIIFSVMILMYWIAVGRTFIFDHKGVTISWLWFSKSVCWDAMNVKQFFNSKNGFGYRDIYSSGMELSYKKISRPTWIKPMQYCFMRHPFSYVVIHFTPDNPPPIKYPAVYEIDRNILIPALNEWGQADAPQ